MKKATNIHPRKTNFEHPDLIEISLNDKKPSFKNSISWKLWLNCQDLAIDALNTDFIQGIKKGKLNPNDYGQYTVQDCAYTYHGQKDYQNLENRAAKMELPELAAFAKARWISYKKYYEEETNNWHIKDPSALKLNEAASWYINSEKKAFSDMYHPIYGIIAMIPCDQLWPWLALELEPSKKESGVYSFWIENNLGFGGAYRLDNFVDSWFKNNPGVYNEDIANYIYRCSMIGELNFFKSGCGQPLTPVPTLLEIQH